MRVFTRNFAVAGFAVLLCGSVALADNTLTVTSPGLEGDFKMTITLDGVSTNQVWVQDNTPSCETTYNVEWMWETPGLDGPTDLDGDDNLTVFLGRQETPADNVITCRLQQQPGGALNPQVRCNTKWDDNKLRFIGQSAYNPNFDHTFRFEIVRASGPASGDGVARFYRNGNLLFERSDIQNFNYCYDRQRLGLGQGVFGNTVGLATDINYDSFVSTR